MKKSLFLVIGCLCLGLGCIGIVLPILPTVPFFLVTAFCFAKSSERLHSWFIGTKMYQRHLKSFVEKRGMFLKTKLTIITTVTLLMGFGFLIMVRKGIWIPCVVLIIVWVCHIIYFVFGVKNIKNGNSDSV